MIALTADPVAQHSLPADQRGDGGGIGPQDARAKPDPRNNGIFRQQVKLRSRKPAFWADQDGPPTGISIPRKALQCPKYGFSATGFIAHQ